MSKKKTASISEISISPVYLSARSAIIQPERSIAVTHYSLNKWLPRLGTDRWSLVQFLRGLCVDAPRRPDGTKRVTISWRMLAGFLQVHEETIASWMKHEILPDDKPWRRIIPSDDYAEYLSLFIPRLRYAYETSKGKTRRVGFLLEVLMEDPIAPEDEIKLTQQVEQMQLQQGELGLQNYRLTESVNPVDLNSLDTSPSSITGVNGNDSHSPHSRHSKARRLTINKVNPSAPDLLSTVKQDSPDLVSRVNDDSANLPQSKSGFIANNVNKLKTYIHQLKQYKLQKRNYQQLLEPVVSFTDTLLDDYHSTAMLYKVAKILFPDDMDLYVAAVEQSLLAYSMDEGVNRGAIFVRTLREFADDAEVDLGFRTSSQPVSQMTFVPEEKQLATTPQLAVEDAIWDETLSILRGHMNKAMFNSVMQSTSLVGAENDTYIINAGSAMAKDWLENRLKNVVRRTLNNVVGANVEVEFRV